VSIEAPEEEAKVIFYNRFGHNPERVSCTCCGGDYSISEEPTLKRLTGYHRNCNSLDTPRGEDGRYEQPDDPWFTEHYYLEPEEEAEAVERGWTIRENTARKIGRQYGDGYGRYLTLEEYTAKPDVLVIPATEIKDEERTGEVPEEGYVWAGG
jgi:hypothetical protein